MKLCNRCDRILTPETSCSFADCPHKDITAAASFAAGENVTSAPDNGYRSASPADPIAAPDGGICAACGTHNMRGAKFCAGCGSKLETIVISEDAPETTAWSDTPQGPSSRTMGFGIAALLIIGLLAYLAFGKGDNGAATSAADAAAEAAAPAKPLGQERAMWVVADANIRDRATAQGSKLLGKLPRGTQINGVMQMGEDGKSQWFRLTENRGFVGAVNLSQAEPPKLAKPLGDQTWYAPEAVAILALPDSNSPKIATLNPGKKIKLSGITDNGFAEAKMDRGGVGYIAPGGYDFSITKPPLTSSGSGDVADFYAAMGLNSTEGPYYFNGTASDQTIRLTIWSTSPKGEIAGAEYRNSRTGNTCSSYMNLIGRDEKGRFRFSQFAAPSGNACKIYTDVVLSPSDGYINAWWMQGDQIFMSAKMRM